MMMKILLLIYYKLFKILSKKIKESIREINIITLDYNTLNSSIKDEIFEIIFNEHIEIDYEKILIKL
jgi:hypothetical protein